MNILEKPKISVIIPCYNAEKYIQDTIDSVFMQTFQDFELILVNDGSTDNTFGVLEKNKLKSKKINIINIENSGESKAFFKGVNQSQAPIIARIDSDDIMSSSRLDNQYNYINKKEGLHILGSWIQKFSNGNNLGIERFVSSSYSIEKLMCIVNQIANPSVIFKREIIKDYFPNDIKIGTDLNFWLHLIAKGYRIGNIPKVLTKYRVHNNQASSNKMLTVEYAKEVYKNNINNLLDTDIDKDFIEFGVQFRNGVDIKHTSDFFYKHIEQLKSEELKYNNLDALSDCVFRIYYNSNANKLSKAKHIITDFYRFGLNIKILEKLIKAYNYA